MSELLEAFTARLRAGDKEGCVELALSALDAGKMDVVSLYATVLAPALNSIECKDDDEARCIWQEHVETAIVRSVIELCHPHVVKAGKLARKEGTRGKVILLNPPEELHEMGARMAADFFTIAGFETTFIGANTPDHAMLAAVQAIKPDIIAISVANYYHLFAVRDMIAKLREKAGEGKGMKILVGGRAFANHPDRCKQAGADGIVSSFEDIKTLEVHA